MVDSRERKHLLVWRDLPHWMIVDDEFRSFLESCDGGRSVEEILRDRPEWAAHGKELLPQLKALVRRGVLEKVGARRRRRASSGKATRIENVAINITGRCNLRCSYCYQDRDCAPNSGKELSAKEITNVLSEIKPLLGKEGFLTILGGEPLLREDAVLDVATAGVRMGMRVLVSTNGTVMTESFARRAKKVGLDVQVSIDGHEAALNDATRGAGSFERSRRGVGRLVEEGVYTILSMVCYRDNVRYLKEFYAMAKRWGTDEARFIPLKNLGCAPDSGLAPVAIHDMIEAGRSVFGHSADLRRLAGRDCFSVIANTCQYAAKRRSCGTGLQTVLLDWDGWLYPCLNLNRPEFRVANVRDTGFAFRRTWLESKVLENVRSSSSVENPRRSCFTCAVKYWCLSGCRGEAYAATGVLDGTASNCADLRRSVTEMFWILADNQEWMGRLTRKG
jgi:radical SAM protein with 4Fe4S-binding SPASM domain